LAVRVIPRLDIKGPNLVKGIHFEGLRVLGKPEAFARYYYQTGADELLYQDAVASLYGRNSLLDIVKKTASEVFIPLTVGGGLRTLDDIRAVLRAGADKVAINTAAVGDPELIRKASRAFGSSTIVVSIEAIRKRDGGYEAYVDYGRESTGVDAFEWALRSEELGAGELMVTSIDREGTGRGYDLDLLAGISEAVSVPVIAAGGVGSIEHVCEGISLGKADAVSMASILHYDAIHKLEFDKAQYSKEGNVEYAVKGPGPLSRIQHTDLVTLKSGLIERGIQCRPYKGQDRG
jgi:cyclase